MTELDPGRAPGDLTGAQVYHYRAEGAVPTAPGVGLNFTSADGAPLDTGVTQAEWDAANTVGPAKNCALLPPGAYLLHVSYNFGGTGAFTVDDIAYNDAAVVVPIDNDVVVLLSVDNTQSLAMLIAKAPVRVAAVVHVAADNADRGAILNLWAVRVA